MRLVETRTQEQRDGMIQAAFIGWQMGAGGQGKTFGQYLSALYLLDTDQAPTKPRDTTAEIIRKAEVIKERLRNERLQSIR